LSVIFLVNTIPLTVKVLSALCIAAHIWAIHREYGKFISSRFRRNG
jgi:hypothetical protein